MSDMLVVLHGRVVFGEDYCLAVRNLVRIMEVDEDTIDYLHPWQTEGQLHEIFAKVVYNEWKVDRCALDYWRTLEDEIQEEFRKLRWYAGSRSR